MALTKEKIQSVMDAFRESPSNTGSPAVQIALLSERIKDLSRHFEVNKKDHASKRGFLKLVGQRRRLLSYLKDRDSRLYLDVVKKLGLRK